MRYKFRGKRLDNGEWAYGNLFSSDGFGKAWILVEFDISGDLFGGAWDIPQDLMNPIEVDPETVGQLVGIKDRKETESFDGDIIKWSVVEMDYQDHLGDNIPNGHYHEKIGWTFKTHIDTIVFENGVFGTKSLGKDELPYPLIWIDTERFDNLNELEEWFAEEDLFKEFGFESVEQLLESLSGFEIIGNIHSNPELEVKANV